MPTSFLVQESSDSKWSIKSRYLIWRCRALLEAADTSHRYLTRTQTQTDLPIYLSIYLYTHTHTKSDIKQLVLCSPAKLQQTDKSTKYDLRQKKRSLFTVFGHCVQLNCINSPRGISTCYKESTTTFNWQVFVNKIRTHIIVQSLADLLVWAAGVLINRVVPLKNVTFLLCPHLKYQNTGKDY